jgi:hypothetical protein
MGALAMVATIVLGVLGMIVGVIRGGLHSPPGTPQGVRIAHYVAGPFVCTLIGLAPLGWTYVSPAFGVDGQASDRVGLAVLVFGLVAGIFVQIVAVRRQRLVDRDRVEGRAG